MCGGRVSVGGASGWRWNMTAWNAKGGKITGNGVAMVFFPMGEFKVEGMAPVPERHELISP